MSKHIMIIIAGGYLLLLGIYAGFSGSDDSPKATAAVATEQAVETAADVKEEVKEAAKVAVEATTEAATVVKEQVAIVKEKVQENVEAVAEAVEEHVETEKHAQAEEKPAKAIVIYNADGSTTKITTQQKTAVDDTVIEAQRAALAKNTEGKGFGPQSPRNIDSLTGNNPRAFQAAPAYTAMNLCNIHFHKNAEHQGGEFTTYAGNGDGHGYHSGYRYNGTLSKAELAPYEGSVGSENHGKLEAGDTIEVHYVHTTADVVPGPTLGSCLSEAIKNPQLRVETQVYVLVNDDKALNFVELAAHGEKNGYQQALNIPTNTGAPVQYAGSTTGPSYNEKGSPFQVTWSVRPKVAKVSIASVGKWLESNTFNEDHAHGVRNLVINPDLLSEIK